MGIRVVERFRFWLLRLAYQIILLFLIREAVWEEALFASVGASRDCRILTYGRGALSTARALARRLPHAKIVGVDSRSTAIRRVIQRISQNRIPNVTVADNPLHPPLPFERGYFDKVVVVLALHRRVPEEKLRLIREMLRILRHSGTLHIIAYDKPTQSAEGSLLALTRYLSGPTAADAHLDGSWIKFLAKAGFTGIRRQASCSTVGARISVVRARKP